MVKNAEVPDQGLPSPSGYIGITAPGSENILEEAGGKIARGRITRSLL